MAPRPPRSPSAPSRPRPRPLRRAARIPAKWRQHAGDTPGGRALSATSRGPGRSVAFLPRHGRHHDFPAHRVNYRANLWALRSLGVRQVLAPCAVGSLRPELGPGTLVVPDQLVDRTTSRVQTYYDARRLPRGLRRPVLPAAARTPAGDRPTQGEDLVDGGAMVVIEGPRFSTRAESQWYAAQGWSLVNMTGHPEAVLARELALCYSAVALVTDLDAGLDAAGSVDQAEVFRVFGENTERLRGLLHHVLATLSTDRDCPVPDALDGHDPAGAAPVRVLLTGAAGFIGRRVGAALREGGDDVVGLDAMIDAAHPAGSRRARRRRARRRTRRRPARPAAAGVDVVCHQSAMVGNGIDAQDLPGFAAHNDLGTAVLLAAMARAGVRRLVLASSMVVYGEGRYTCPDDGDVVPLPRRRRGPRRRRLRPALPVLRRGWSAGTWWARTRRSGRAAAMRSRRSRRSSTPTPGRRSGSGRCVALRYHNVYGPDMPADTPYAGVAAIFRSALERGEGPPVFEDGAQMRDFVHVDDVAAANVAAVQRVADHPVGVHAVQRLLRPPHRIATMARLIAEEHGGPEPVVTGRYRAADVRHVVAVAGRCRRAAWLPAAVLPGRRAARVRPRPAAAHPMTAHPAPRYLPGRTRRRWRPPRRKIRRPSATSPGSSGRMRAGDHLAGRSGGGGGGVRCDVVLPCRDEALALPPVLAAIPTGMRAIVVDNGSRDDTAAVARAHGARVVTEPRPGYGAAVHAGVLAATAPLVAVVDGDGSLDPQDLVRLADLVDAGSRRRWRSDDGAPRDRGVWPWHARAGNAVICWRLRRTAGLPVHDIAPIRVCRREDLLALDVRDRRFGYPLELLVKAGAAGWTLVEVDVPYRPRAAGTRSKVSGRRARGTIAGDARLRARVLS